METKTILGIDPGTSLMGYGIISIVNKNPQLVTLGVMELHKYSDHFQKLERIFRRTLSLIDEFKVDEMALEAPFFGKNVQAMLKLGRAQGVAMSAGLYRGLPIAEYQPRKIKQAVTGNGNASKEQVATILRGMMHMKIEPQFLDATDGLATAVCHYYQQNLPVNTASVKSWKDFINKNPGRVGLK